MAQFNLDKNETEGPLMVFNMEGKLHKRIISFFHFVQKVLLFVEYKKNEEKIFKEIFLKKKELYKESL